MDPVLVQVLDDDTLVVEDTLLDFLTDQTKEAEDLLLRTVSLAPLITFEGFTESDVFQQAAEWSRQHIDRQDAGIVATVFQH